MSSELSPMKIKITKITKIKITSERRSAILTLSLWETPEVTTAAMR
jgi:hypothetical protein